MVGGVGVMGRVHKVEWVWWTDYCEWSGCIVGTTVVEVGVSGGWGGCGGQTNMSEVGVVGR